MTTPMQKGNALEFAVKAIETAILKASPALKENTFLIESKKIVTVAGVRHEIDIWVEVDLGKGYRAIFIFECKNWEEKVGKNEIIVFSEKIEALQTQKGFFVAKSFTADAEAQAGKDPRIVLLRATEREETPVPFDFHFLIRDKTNVDLRFFQMGATEKLRNERMDLQKAEAYLRGERLDLHAYGNDWANDLCNAKLKSFPSGTTHEGEYELEASGDRTYEEGELKIQGKEFTRSEAHVKFTVRVVRPPVMSDFEIESRGRVLSLAPVLIGDGAVQIGFIAVPKEKGAA